MSYQANDSVSWVKGKHNMKFGGEFRALEFNVRRLTQASGEFDFNAVPNKQHRGCGWSRRRSGSEFVNSAW